MIDQRTVRYLGAGLLVVLVAFMIYYQFYRDPCDFPPHIARKHRTNLSSEGDSPAYCGIKNWNNPEHSMKYNSSVDSVSRSGDVGECRKMCDQTAGCTGFGYNTRNRFCWLKQWPSMAEMASRNNSFNPCCTSYIRN